MRAISSVLLVLLVLLLAAASPAAVTLHATTTASLFLERAGPWIGRGCVEASGPFSYDYLLLDNAAPASATSDSFAASSTAPPCEFQRTTGNAFIWFLSEPLSGAFTISGAISGVCSGVESATATNCGCSLTLYRYDSRRGALATTPIWSGNVTNEYGTSCATRAITGSTTSTAVVTGDRLVLVPTAFAISNTTPGSWGGNGTRTCGICYNGAAASANEVSVTITEDLTFNADAAGPTGTMETLP